MSCGRPLVEVVRLHRRCRHNQFLVVPGSDVDYLIDVLEGTFDEQELGVSHKRPVSLVKLRIDDGVRDVGFVFDGKKDETVSRARTLSRNHTAGNLQRRDLRVVLSSSWSRGFSLRYQQRRITRFAESNKCERVAYSSQ